MTRKENMFETASRMKLRFNTNKGNATVENLWDMPLTSNYTTSLDSLAQELNKEVEKSAEKSYVIKKNKANALSKLKFAIVLYVLDAKVEEAEAVKLAQVNKAEKGRIGEIIAELEDEALRDEGLAKLKKKYKRM